MQNTFVIRFKEAKELEDARNLLGVNGGIDYIEHIARHQFFYIPNDLDPNQYYLQLIQAEQAWDISSNASMVTIAIIDDAIELAHPDLAGNIFINSGEIPGNGFDDDGNGFIDDISGWDFADFDNDPSPLGSLPLLDHGTHVAGLASAVTDNANGIASIGANARILPLKIGQDINGVLINEAISIDYAIYNNANIISMSWGGGFYSQTLQDLFDIAYQQGIICVAAAGNSNTNAIFYPAGYNHVLSVGATDELDQKASFSNYGSNIDVAAPGVSIYSTWNGASLLTNKSGTSMSTPIVSGLCALMKSANPLATVDEIQSCILSTCDAVIGAYSSQMGAGRINAYEAMMCITSPSANFTSNITQICAGNSIEFYNYSWGPGLTFDWSFPGGTPSSSNNQNPIITYNSSGIYDVTLTVTNSSGVSTSVLTNYIVVQDPTVVISGNSTIVSGGYGSIVLDYNGIPPFDVTLTDGTSMFSVNGITSDPYLYYLSPSASSTYSVVSFNDSQCNGTASGTAQINVNSSSVCDPLTSSFVKYMGTDIDDRATSVQEIAPYGFIVMGKKVLSATNFRNYVSLIDDCGAVMWEFVFNNSQYGIPVAAQLQNDTIIISAYNGTSINDVKTFIILLDLSGNVLDVKSYGTGATYPRYMERLLDGNLLVGGVTNTSPGFGGNDQFAFKFSPQGNLIWQRRLGINYNEYLHDLTEDGDSNILTVGYARDYVVGLRSGYVTKLDKNGMQQWTNRYDMGSGYTYFNSIYHHANYYYASGYTNTNTYGLEDGIIVKLDTDGNIIWSKKVGGTNYDMLSGSVVINDTLFVYGLSSSGNPSVDAFVAKLDLDGNLLSSTSFGTAGNENFFNVGQLFGATSYGSLYGVCDGNGGFIGGSDLIFFKINSLADNCNPSSVSIAVSPTPIVMTNFNMNQSIPTTNFIAGSWTPLLNTSNQGYLCSNLTYIDSTNCDILSDFSIVPVTCYGDSVQFINQSSSSLNDVSLLAWDFGDGNQIQIGYPGNINHLYISPGTYSVSLIAIDTISGCSDTSTYVLDLTTLPFINLPDTLSICIGDTGLIQSSLYCFSPSATVDWYNDSILFNETDSSVQIIPSISQYVFVIIDENGTSFIDSCFIEVLQNCCSDVAQIVSTGSGLCSNDTINFSLTNYVISGSPIINWSFNPDGNPSSFNGYTPPGVTFLTTGPKEIIVEISDSCGIQYDTLQVTIFSEPVFDAGMDTIICINDSLTLGGVGSDDWTYIWTPGLNLSDSTIANPLVIIDTNTALIVNITDPWTGCSMSDTVSISISNPEIIVNQLVNVSCANGDDGQINLSVNGGCPQYDFLWNQGQFNGPIQTNLAAGTYYITVIDSIGCSDSTSLTITEPDILEISEIVDNTDCGNNNGSITVAPIGGTPGYMFNWTQGDTANILNNLGPGSYEVTVTDSNGCEVSEIYSVLTEGSIPVWINYNEVTINEGDSIQLIANGASYYFWTPNYGLTCDDCPDPIASPTLTTMYIVAGYDSLGCMGIDTVLIIVTTKCRDIFIPTIFSPNGNGPAANEFLCVYGNCITNLTFSIFNRWGEMVFQTNEAVDGLNIKNEICWDGLYKGKPVQSGTYVYSLEAVGNGEAIFLSGNITVVR